LSYPLCQASEQWPHQILKGGHRLLCANLANPAPADAARNCDVAPSLLAGHGPLRATRNRSLAAAAILGLLAGHGPLRVARSHGLVATAVPSLLARHGPLCATCGRSPAIAAELWWTCGRDSSKISCAKQQYK